jgi:hypothetical protein
MRHTVGYKKQVLSTNRTSDVVFFLVIQVFAEWNFPNCSFLLNEYVSTVSLTFYSVVERSSLLNSVTCIEATVHSRLGSIAVVALRSLHSVDP